MTEDVKTLVLSAAAAARAAILETGCGEVRPGFAERSALKAAHRSHRPGPSAPRDIVSSAIVVA